MSAGIVRNVAGAALVGALVLAPPSAARAALVFDGRWVKPGLNHWDQVVNLKPGNRNRLTFVTQPRRRASGYAADLLVGGNAESERIEFLKADLFSHAEGKAGWWAWSFLIRADSTLPDAVVVTQINSKFNGDYCSVAAGGAANGLRMVNPVAGHRADRWYWAITGGKGACRIKQIRIPGLRVVKGRWIDFLCYFKWSSGPTGVSSCSYRAQPRQAWRRAFAVGGANLVSSPSFAGNLRIEQGLYKGESAPYVHIVQGGLVVARTRDDAVRAAFGEGDVVATRASTSHLGVIAAVVAAAAAAAALLVRRRSS
jgi:hypothetical protein